LTVPSKHPTTSKVSSTHRAFEEMAAAGEDGPAKASADILAKNLAKTSSAVCEKILAAF
jgi:hypothetical protein